MKKAKDVDAYIESAPQEVKVKLMQLRKVIKDVVPNAEEKISYSMPYYAYKGRVAYFSYAKAHIGLYITPPIIAEHKKELAGYSTATATIRFSLTKDLPLALIKKLIAARVKRNEELGKKK